MHQHKSGENARNNFIALWVNDTKEEILKHPEKN